MQVTNVYERNIKALKSKKFFIINKGGTRSGKTFAVLQMLITLALKSKKKRVISVISETFPHIKRGARREFIKIMTGDNLFDERAWNKTDSIYTFLNGTIIEFFSADSPAKVHGPARDILFINEAQNISKEIAVQLFIRTRERVILDYNPTFDFWVDSDIIGKGREVMIHSTYLDNPLLSDNQIAEIESHRDNANWWRVYGLGLTGQLEGVVYTFTQVDSMPEGVRFYGMDFGFTNDPTAIVSVIVKGNDVYINEECYRTGMLNSDIISALLRIGVKKQSTEIYADSAEPKSIEEIYRAGYNIKPCVKGANSIISGIQKVKEYNIKVTSSSTNLIKELRSYTWEVDKNGKYLNVPVDYDNHLCDALRYAIYTKLSKRGGNPPKLNLLRL